MMLANIHFGCRIGSTAAGLGIPLWSVCDKRRVFGLHLCRGVGAPFLDDEGAAQKYLDKNKMGRKLTGDDILLRLRDRDDVELVEFAGHAKPRG